MTAAVDRLVEPAPATRLAMLRILVGGYAVGWSLVRLPAHLDSTTQSATRWDPPGVWAWSDAPIPGAAVVALAIGVPLVGLLFVGGWRFRVVGPTFAAGLLGLATLDSSWGQIFHTENLMVLHVATVGLAPAAADTMAVGWSPRRGGVPVPDARYGWPVRLCAGAVVVAYAVSGLAKLRLGGLGWVDGSTLRNLVAYDNLRKELLGDWHSPIGTWLVRYGWMFPVMAVAAMAVELGGWVTLLGRRWRMAWVVAAWGFHVGVLAMMAITFPYQLSGVAFAPFFRLERLADRFVSRNSARSGCS